MRSLKCLKFPGKPPKAQTAGQKYEHYEKLTPELFKMSFFMKFKTSSTLPPYYSTEPMKYALRVIFWCRECFLMIPEAPQPQIWTHSWNLKNRHFHHFLWSLSSVLSRGGNDLSCILWGSPFACAHQNGWSFRENLQSPSRPAKNMSTLKNSPPKSSKCHFSWSLRLALPCRRITL